MNRFEVNFYTTDYLIDICEGFDYYTKHRLKYVMVNRASISKKCKINTK